MHAQVITNWKAKRAGGRITVYGTDRATGEPTKLVGVDEVRFEANDGHPIILAVINHTNPPQVVRLSL